MSRRFCLFYPFLAALYFVLTLAAANVAELRGAGDLAFPLAGSLLVCGLCWGLGLALTRDPRKASLLALLWLVAFSVFGYVADELRPAGLMKLLGGEPGLTGIFAAIVFGPSLAIRRSNRAWDGLSRYLTMVGILVVAFTGAKLWWGLRQEHGPATLFSPPPVPAADPGGREPANIFLIVLDKYTGSELLAQHFAFDNSTFETFLQRRGFVVPRHSRANYPQTDLALASLLNLDYVQNLPLRFHLNDLIENNRLAAFLKSRGYRFVFFPTHFRLTHRNRNADLQLVPPDQGRGELGVAWEQSTMLPEILSAGCAVLGCQPGRLRYAPQTADMLDWKFERLKEIATAPQPTFVFAHLILPHEPYVYDAACGHREPYWPLASGILGDAAADSGYLAQVSCANRKVMDLVEAILSRSRRPPVILLQADHGHGRMGALPELGKARRYQLRERMSAFSAYLMPGVASEDISDSITPVNATRLLLRHYFGAELPPLEDASYWSIEKRPLDLVRIR